MKNIRTKKSHRETYRYYFADGTTQLIEISDEVTAADIALLHQLDDEEVNAEHRKRYNVPSYLEDFSYDNENEQFSTHPLLVEDRTPLNLLSQYEKREQKEKKLRALKKALKKLTPNQRQTIEKIFYKGMNQFELAREEGTSRAAIFYRLNGAYKKLRKEIEKIT
ncbi:sigma factor-like helix-turn-helix DNA-binding protein [Lactococcus garvieae]|uniref:sigma factor-like helix-turn-helix DNA-binding protein n=1 Tax=Lactococcus garvieae TaxID=1363 RepID=UPI0030CC6C04